MPTHKKSLLESIVLGHMAVRPDSEWNPKKRAFYRNEVAAITRQRGLATCWLSSLWELKNCSLPMYNLHY